MSNALLAAAVFLLACTIGALLWIPLSRALSEPVVTARAQRPTEVGIGTVRAVDEHVTLDVECVTGQHFVGSLRQDADGASLGQLQPGVLLLVTFDPAEREHLSLADDMVAVRTAFDQMLVRKGLVAPAQMDLIRYGVKSRGTVTAMKSTGIAREDYREVEVDLMVRRATGGQFPARETTLVPASALTNVAPGCMVDVYYRSGDESSVAVSVPPA